MIAVVYYFQMKHDQATSQTEVIHLEAEVKSTAAVTKTAEGRLNTAKTANVAADTTAAAAFKKFSDHMLSGKAKTEHLKGVELSKAYSSAAILATTASTNYNEAVGAYDAAKALSDVAATTLATAKT